MLSVDFKVVGKCIWGKLFKLQLPFEKFISLIWVYWKSYEENRIIMIWKIVRLDNANTETTGSHQLVVLAVSGFL
jgi:hypothetical protein